MREDIAISSTKFNILKWLSYYRGLTADQLAKLIYCTNSITVSNSKSMYNQLKKLEDIGLVKRYRAHPKISKFSIYYLSAKGLEFIQMKLNILEGIREEGWITNQDYLKLGYFKYDTYKPPFKQMTHHLFVVDTLITCYVNDICHRNNLYASRLSDNILLRPDAEMKINSKHYLIEIDNGTENHQQLIEKFNRYFHYVASTRDNKDIDVIVFIIDTKHSEQLNRRWISILAAFHIAMRRIYNLVKLVLITKEEFPLYIDLEKNRPSLINRVAIHLDNKWDFGDDVLLSIIHKEYYSLTGKDKYINFHLSTTKYSSNYVDLNPEISFIGYFTDTEPIIYTDLTLYRDVPSEIIEKYQKISKNLYLERII